MKNILVSSLAMALLFGSYASADFIGENSTYFIAPGAGIAKGFQVAGGPFVDSTFDGILDVVGPDISGNGMIVSSESLTDNGGGNFDLVLRIATTVGGNLLPTGVIGDSGEELTSLGLFVGGGINPVDVIDPIIANTAQIEVFDTDADSLGTIDVIDMSNFTTGLGGGWDGSLGLNFGNAIEIGDVGAIELQINFGSQSVPEPSSALVLVSLLSLTMTRRRRN